MHDYTPNPSHNPSLIPELDDGDAPDASNINTSIEALADKVAHALVGSGSSADMQALTSPLPGERFLVQGWGPFYYSVSEPFTPDSLWVFAATGAGVGQWILEVMSFANVGLAGVGPIPGDFTPAATNRIKTSLVPYGYQTHNIYPQMIYSTTSTTYHVFVTQTIGALVAGDIVEGHISATVACTAYFRAGTYASENAGIYSVVSPADVILVDEPVSYEGTSANQPVALSFYHVVGADGTFRIQLWGKTYSGASPLQLTIGSWLIKVIRP